jgi:hypothetical protein
VSTNNVCLVCFLRSRLASTIKRKNCVEGTIPTLTCMNAFVSNRKLKNEWYRTVQLVEDVFIEKTCMYRKFLHKKGKHCFMTRAYDTRIMIEIMVVESTKELILSRSRTNKIIKEMTATLS